MLTSDLSSKKRTRKSKSRRCQFDFVVEKAGVDTEKLVCRCWPVQHWRVILITPRAAYLAALLQHGLLTKGGAAWQEATTGKRLAKEEE
jgi:hypothetical protein